MRCQLMQCSGSGSGSAPRRPHCGRGPAGGGGEGADRLGLLHRRQLLLQAHVVVDKPHAAQLHYKPRATASRQMRARQHSSQGC